MVSFALNCDLVNTFLFWMFLSTNAYAVPKVIIHIMVETLIVQRRDPWEIFYSISPPASNSNPCSLKINRLHLKFGLNLDDNVFLYSHNYTAVLRMVYRWSDAKRKRKNKLIYCTVNIEFKMIMQAGIIPFLWRHKHAYPPFVAY